MQPIITLAYNFTFIYFFALSPLFIHLQLDPNQLISDDLKPGFRSRNFLTMCTVIRLRSYNSIEVWPPAARKSANESVYLNTFLSDFNPEIC
jgi:hypothetical protein